MYDLILFLGQPPPKEISFSASSKLTMKTRVKNVLKLVIQEVLQTHPFKKVELFAFFIWQWFMIFPYRMILCDTRKIHIFYKFFNTYFSINIFYKFFNTYFLIHIFKYIFHTFFDNSFLQIFLFLRGHAALSFRRGAEMRGIPLRQGMV